MRCQQGAAPAGQPAGRSASHHISRPCNDFRSGTRTSLWASKPAAVEVAGRSCAAWDRVRDQIVHQDDIARGGWGQAGAWPGSCMRGEVGKPPTCAGEAAQPVLYRPAARGRAGAAPTPAALRLGVNSPWTHFAPPTAQAPAPAYGEVGPSRRPGPLRSTSWASTRAARRRRRVDATDQPPASRRGMRAKCAVQAPQNAAGTPLPPLLRVKPEDAGDMLPGLGANSSVEGGLGFGGSGSTAPPAMPPLARLRHHHHSPPGAVPFPAQVRLAALLKPRSSQGSSYNAGRGVGRVPSWLCRPTAPG